VLPTREDIWGLVINEALANALPTISSNKCTAGNELITNNVNGFVYECDDTDALAECINKLANNEEMRDRFSLNAIKSIEQYTLENIISGHIENINRVVSK
jgi:glycosyltransferase involved in cell wall biosynthesis